MPRHKWIRGTEGELRPLAGYLPHRLASGPSCAGRGGGGSYKVRGSVSGALVASAAPPRRALHCAGRSTVPHTERRQRSWAPQCLVLCQVCTHSKNPPGMLVERTGTGAGAGTGHGDQGQGPGPSASDQIRVPSAAGLSPSGLGRAGDLRQRNKKNISRKRTPSVLAPLAHWYPIHPHLHRRSAPSLGTGHLLPDWRTAGPRYLMWNMESDGARWEGE